MTAAERRFGQLEATAPRPSDPLPRLLLCRMPSEGGRQVGEPRLVTVRRPGVEVGVTLCGGNLRGVYIDSVDEDSPARNPDGLLPGDLILEVSKPGWL